MKKIILLVMVGVLLAGVNVFAAGDLVVNGKLGVGTAISQYTTHIVSTDSPTSLRLEPTINNLTVNSNFAAYYKMIVGSTTLTSGVFTAFAGNTMLTGGGTGITLRGAENNVVLSSGTPSTIDLALGSKAELRRTGGNSASHTITNYYGFHSKGRILGGSGAFSGTDWRHAYYENLPSFGGTVTNVSGLWIDKQTIGTNNYGIVLNGDGAGADIVFGASQQASIYSASGLLYAKDSTGNITQFSPHDPVTGEWRFYSKNIKTGKVLEVNMEKLVRAVEKLTGEKFMIETFEAVD